MFAVALGSDSERRPLFVGPPPPPPSVEMSSLLFLDCLSVDKLTVEANVPNAMERAVCAGYSEYPWLC